MRVICPHVGSPHPRTKAVLDSWPNVSYVDVSGSETAYSELVCGLWGDGQGFILIEHDIVPWSWVYAEFVTSGELFAAYPYAWTTNVGVALGCNYFSSFFTRHFDTAAQEAADVPGAYGKGHFREFDYWLMRTILEEKYRQVPSLRLPPVEHCNEAKKLVEPFKSRSLATHLRMVGYELAADGRSAKWVGRFRQAVKAPS